MCRCQGQEPLHRRGDRTPRQGEPVHLDRGMRSSGLHSYRDKLRSLLVTSYQYTKE